MATKIYFDLDGTVYDLYSVNNWLKKLRLEDETAYTEGEPLIDMKELSNLCNEMKDKNFTFGVITWLSKGSSRKYEKKVAKVKKEWVKKYMPFVTEFHAQSYGVPKQKAIVGNVKHIYLVDDNAEVRKLWDTPKQRKSIDATKDIISQLRNLICE